MKLAAEVKNFDAEGLLGKKEARRMDRFIQFAICASREAMKDSNLNVEEIDATRFGVIIVLVLVVWKLWKENAKF